MKSFEADFHDVVDVGVQPVRPGRRVGQQAEAGERAAPRQPRVQPRRLWGEVS